MKKSVWGCWLLIIFSAWLTGCSPEKIEIEIPPTGETIFFSPQNLTVRTYSYFSLDVEINSVENIFGVGLDIKYDPVFFEWIRVSDEGSFLSDNGQVFLATASFVPGELSFGLTRLGKNSGSVSGPGLVATLTFKSLGQRGRSQINFSKNHICILEEDGSHYFKNIAQRAALITVE